MNEGWGSIPEGGISAKAAVAGPAALRGLHSQLADHLGQAIGSGEIVAGQQIVPEDLVESFGVSRTVVREVLKVLEAKGMVGARPRTGTRVRPQGEWNLLDGDVIRWRSAGPDAARQIEELLGIRSAIEPLAARNASKGCSPADRQALLEALEEMAEAVKQQDWDAFTDADVAFHSALLTASGSLVITQFVEPIEAALRVRHRLQLVPDSLDEAVVDSHQAILEAIIEGNGAQAEFASRRIVDVAGAETIDSLLSGERLGGSRAGSADG